jgi:Zn-dependent M16 (insulinase) family peptidase
MLSHEEVINQLDNETVSYAVDLGVSYYFTDIFHVSIEVEIAHYETAIAWLKDLVYGADFNKDRYISDKKNYLYFMTYLFFNRLQVVLAKIQQSLPERKRDGEAVLESLWNSLMFDDSSTSRAGGVLPQAEFIPKLLKSLQESPDEVIADFEEIRKYSKLTAVLFKTRPIYFSI